MSALNSVAVVGAGAWGTALANAAARAGRDVTLVARDDATAMNIAMHRTSPRLPGIKLESKVVMTGNAADAARAQVILLVVPAQALRATLKPFAAAIPQGCVVMACAKGIERTTGLFMTEIIAELAPRAVPAILSGPSFADDVARGLPTAVTLAAPDEPIAAALCQALGSPTFRPYHTTDVRGVEIGGAAKNVLAIAAGIVVGRKLGASALAALTTRGFAELTRFGRACGAQPETLAGLSGLGDLVLSCSSPQSRNFSFGIALGQGQSAAQAAGGKLAEGAFTASVLLDIARTKGIDMPISEAVASILDGRTDIDTAITGLLARPFKAEG
ncbi:NAD(P)H-dependent glycerol-3-phosphate dehydrogenase [Bradyrhizobium prioriisuperbiae]|uniref:NAD(P)H-dependent glycerol-3-phosphate dehydrogenase n=1 Tax=Bradyrhizobium prioriisuperbiae TaxID=2854389 RepID=UPI0028E228EE|nr:NAD(P)H-dependent glycerol-3-phosphate dehydrogenase [Bradyrhizobium prioritasuperba]